MPFEPTGSHGVHEKYPQIGKPFRPYSEPYSTVETIEGNSKASSTSSSIVNNDGINVYSNTQIFSTFQLGGDKDGL